LPACCSSPAASSRCGRLTEFSCYRSP
jgi:hypothetical protein